MISLDKVERSGPGLLTNDEVEGEFRQRGAEAAMEGVEDL